MGKNNVTVYDRQSDGASRGGQRSGNTSSYYKKSADDHDDGLDTTQRAAFPLSMDFLAKKTRKQAQLRRSKATKRARPAASAATGAAAAAADTAGADTDAADDAAYDDIETFSDADGEGEGDYGDGEEDVSNCDIEDEEDESWDWDSKGLPTTAEEYLYRVRVEAGRITTVVDSSASAGSTTAGNTETSNSVITTNSNSSLTSAATPANDAMTDDPVGVSVPTVSGAKSDANAADADVASCDPAIQTDNPDVTIAASADSDRRSTHAVIKAASSPGAKSTQSHSQAQSSQPALTPYQRYLAAARAARPHPALVPAQNSITNTHHGARGSACCVSDAAVAAATAHVTLKALRRYLHQHWSHYRHGIVVSVTNAFLLADAHRLVAPALSQSVPAAYFAAAAADVALTGGQFVGAGWGDSGQVTVNSDGALVSSTSASQSGSATVNMAVSAAVEMAQPWSANSGNNSNTSLSTPFWPWYPMQSEAANTHTSDVSAANACVTKSPWRPGASGASVDPDGPAALLHILGTRLTLPTKGSLRSGARSVNRLTMSPSAQLRAFYSQQVNSDEPQDAEVEAPGGAASEDASSNAALESEMMPCFDVLYLCLPHHQGSSDSQQPLHPFVMPMLPPLYLRSSSDYPDSDPLPCGHKPDVSADNVVAAADPSAAMPSSPPATFTKRQPTLRSVNSTAGTIGNEAGNNDDNTDDALLPPPPPPPQSETPPPPPPPPPADDAADSPSRADGSQSLASDSKPPAQSSQSPAQGAQCGVCAPLLKGAVASVKTVLQLEPVVISALLPALATTMTSEWDAIISVMKTSDCEQHMFSTARTMRTLIQFADTETRGASPASDAASSQDRAAEPATAVDTVLALPVLSAHALQWLWLLCCAADTPLDADAASALSALHRMLGAVRNTLAKAVVRIAKVAGHKKSGGVDSESDFAALLSPNAVLPAYVEGSADDEAGSETVAALPAEWRRAVTGVAGQYSAILRVIRTRFRQGSFE